MKTAFVLLIAIALAAGIFGTVVQSGANIVHLDRNMTLVGLITGGFQILGCVVGYLIGNRILEYDLQSGTKEFWIHAFSGVLLALIGIHMLMRAFEKRTLLEHRIERIDMKKDVYIGLQLCLNAVLAGVASGVLGFNLLMLLLAIFTATLISAIVGYVSGRANGADHYDRAYLFGGGLLCVLSVVLQIV